MSIKYSGTVITKFITGSNGEERLYKASKMRAPTITKEGFRLLKAFAPAFGAGVDSLATKAQNEEDFLPNQSSTYSGIFFALSESLGDDHFEDLEQKLMGSLYFGDTLLTEDSDHFDKHPEDYLDILVWLFKENFITFFSVSPIVQSMKDKMLGLMSPKLKDGLESLVKSASDSLKTE